MNTLFRRRKNLIIFMILTAILFCSCAVKKEEGNHVRKDTAFTFRDVSESFEKEEAAAAVVRPIETVEEKKPVFILRLVGSELRVVSCEDEESYTVIKTADARTFRQADRLKLIDGIEIYTMEELSQFIEDFSS